LDVVSTVIAGFIALLFWQQLPIDYVLMTTAAMLSLAPFSNALATNSAAVSAGLDRSANESRITLSAIASYNPSVHNKKQSNDKAGKGRAHILESAVAESVKADGSVNTDYRFNQASTDIGRLLYPLVLDVSFMNIAQTIICHLTGNTTARMAAHAVGNSKKLPVTV
jgi:hypothetical protein